MCTQLLFFYIGRIGDDADPNSEDFPWETYWRSIFRKITDDDIREYESKYKGMYLKLHSFKVITFFVLIIKKKKKWF